MFHLLSIVSNAALNTSELVQDPDFRFLSPFLGHGLSDLKFPDQGLNLDPLHREHTVLATGKSPNQLIFKPQFSQLQNEASKKELALN